MSRSRPKQKTAQDREPFSVGFPIGRSVCGCYLKKITVKQKMWGDVPYNVVYLHFLHQNSGKWITKFIADKPREAFDDLAKYESVKLNTAQSLENLMACYLSPDHMKHIMFQTSVSGIIDLVKEINDALTKKQFWDTEICLKTLPNDDGGVSLAYYTPYMNLPTGTSWTLSYSRWENEKIFKHKKQLKK